MTQEELEDNLVTLMDNTTLWPFYKALFDKKLSKDNLAITHMLTTINIGGPLKNETFKFENTTHLKDEQTDMLKEFILEYKKEFADENTVENLGFYAT